MSKYFTKILSTTFILAVSIFFVNVNSVKAATINVDGTCTCYYKYHETNSSDKDHDDNIYYWAMTFGDTIARVDHSCVVRGTTKLCDAGEKAVQRSNPFDVDSRDIANNQCSNCYSNINVCVDDNTRVSFDTVKISGSKASLFTGDDFIKYDDDSRDTRICQVIGKPNVIDEKEFNDILNNSKDSAFDNDPRDPVDADDIKNWGKDPVDGIFGDLSKDNCNVISTTLKGYLRMGLLVIAIVAIIILVVMTMLDFIKVVAGNEDGKIKKAFKNMIIRIICSVILLLLPLITGWIIDLVNKNLGDYEIGADGQPFCGIENNDAENLKNNSAIGGGTYGS